MSKEKVTLILQSTGEPKSKDFGAQIHVFGFFLLIALIKSESIEDRRQNH